MKEGKEKKPTIVYYIYNDIRGYVGPYANKPSKVLLAKYFGEIKIFNLTEKE